nr:hypothetical protein [Bradyrhizobium elkanii]
MKSTFMSRDPILRNARPVKAIPGSRHVIRFAIDPASRKAKYASDQKLADYRDTDALWRLIGSLPALSESVGEQKCLGTEPPPKAATFKGQRLTRPEWCGFSLPVEPLPPVLLAGTGKRRKSN